MSKMTLHNTEGYTQAELDALNAEFKHRYEAGEWNAVANDEDEAQKIFADEIARR